MRRITLNDRKLDLMPQVDITAPEAGVDVSWSEDGKILWVNVDGYCVLRICRIPHLVAHDRVVLPPMTAGAVEDWEFVEEEADRTGKTIDEVNRGDMAGEAVLDLDRISELDREEAALVFADEYASGTIAEGLDQDELDG